MWLNPPHISANAGQITPTKSMEKRECFLSLSVYLPAHTGREIHRTWALSQGEQARICEVSGVGSVVRCFPGAVMYVRRDL